MRKNASHRNWNTALVTHYPPLRRRDWSALPCIMLIGLIVGYIALALLEAATR